MKSLCLIDTRKEYHALHNYACLNTEDFWLSQAKTLSWMSEPEMALRDSDEENSWFTGGMLNVCFNCIDRNVMEDPSRIALISDNGVDTKKYSYSQLQREVCIASNILLELGAKANDTITLYLESSPELAIFMLACARIGVKHNVVYQGFSALSLATRISLSRSRILVTNDFYDDDLQSFFSDQFNKNEIQYPTLEMSLWLNNKPNTHLNSIPSYYFDDLRKNLPLVNTPIPRNSNDDLFIFFQSNHEGKPQVFTHSCAGFLLHNSMAFKMMNNTSQGDIYWCGLDLSWFEGHAQGLYGPLANGGTIYMPSKKLCKDPRMLVTRINKARVTHAYLRTCFIKKLNKEKLLTQNTFGHFKNIILSGDSLDPITYSILRQSLRDETQVKSCFSKIELGGPALSQWAREKNIKPGSSGYPFPGMNIKITDEDDFELEPKEEGFLKIASKWPSMPKSFLAHTYDKNLLMVNNKIGFPTLKNYASKDYDGDFWVDDTSQSELSIKGHKLPLAEIESHIESMSKVHSCIAFPIINEENTAEISCFIKLETPDLENNLIELNLNEVKEHVRTQLGCFINVKFIFICNDLPVYPDGTIMKDIIRDIIQHLETSTYHGEDLNLFPVKPSQFTEIASHYNKL